jgi:hypothetical protein
MTRYTPAQHYTWFGITAVVLAAAFTWVGVSYHSPLVFAPSVFAALTAALLFLMAFRPAIETHEGYLAIGKRIIPFDDSRLVVIYPGDLDACNSLLRHLRRYSRDALIDGIPYRQYWGEVLATGGERKTPPPPRYRILRPEDEAEVERLYQRLKTVGNLDQKNSTDEK